MSLHRPETYTAPFTGYYCPPPGAAPQYFPPYTPEPPLPAPDWDHIVWVPIVIRKRYGCDACRVSGVCMCVRPNTGPTCSIN